MNCKVCGEQVKRGEKFCNKCGAPIMKVKENSVFQNNKFLNSLSDKLDKAKKYGNNLKKEIKTDVNNFVVDVKEDLDRELTMEVNYNKDNEETFINMGFEWIKNIDTGEELRLIKKYGEIDVEIETYNNELSDIYFKSESDIVDDNQLISVIFDIIRLRNLIYVRYIGENEAKPIQEFAKIFNIIDIKNEKPIKINHSLNIYLNKNTVTKLQQEGFKKFIDKDIGKARILCLEKESIKIKATTNERILNNSKFNVLGKLEIYNKPSTFNPYDNSMLNNIIEILELKEVLLVKNIDTEEMVTFTEFFNNTNILYSQISDMKQNDTTNENSKSLQNDSKWASITNKLNTGLNIVEGKIAQGINKVEEKKINTKREKRK